MKINFFHLMPYKALPEDFAEKHRSAWVDLPNENFDPALGAKYYHEYLDELEFADKLGFDGICVNEHHSNAYGLMPSPNLMASTLARTTRRSALVVLGNSLGLYQPSHRVAEEMAMIDVMSGGRLVAGFPVGTSMDTNFSYGQNPVTIRERHTEAHDLIMKAWTEREPFAFNGKYNKLRYVNVWPRPMQQPRPPVWVPGSGSLETWNWVLERDYVYCYLIYTGWLRGRRTAQGFRDRAVEMGVDDNPYRMGFLQMVGVSETDEQAEAEYFPHVKYFYEKMIRIYRQFSAPGYRSIETMRASATRELLEEQASLQKVETWQDYLDAGYIIAGSPDTVKKQLRKAIEELRIGHLMTLLQIGSMPRHQAMKNMELFAKEVMPGLKDIWNDYEDHWWPAAVPDRLESLV